MLSAMSPNLQAILGLSKPSGIGTANNTDEDSKDSNKNDWRPPPFAGLNNSRHVTVLRPVVVGHGKGFDVEYKNRRRKEEEEGEDGDEEDDSSEEKGWDYQGITSKPLCRMGLCHL